MASPSGDIYATREQVARLEEIITQQQIVIKRLEQQSDFFSRNLNEAIDEQIQDVLKKSGSRSIEYLNVTKFLTKHVAQAILQLQTANSKMIQETIPVKTLQLLEKRLASRPSATEDLANLAARINDLEISVKEIPVKQIQQIQEIQQAGVAGINSVTTEEIETMKQHIRYIEDNLLKEIDRSHKSVTKVGEISAPFMKLQQQVLFLQQDIQSIKANDNQAMAEKLITNAAAVLRHEFQDFMATRASSDELKKLSLDISRIEEFSREVQTGFYNMRNKAQQLMDDMTNNFSVEKWNKLATHFKKDVLSSIEVLRQNFNNEIQIKTAETEHILDKTNKIINKLDNEIRSQYGPQMLERHLTEIQRALEIQQTGFQQGLEKQLETKLDIMDKQLNSYRQTIREFTAEIRNEISATGLLEKYAEFDKQLNSQQQMFSQWIIKLNHLDDWHRMFKQEVEELKYQTIREIKGFGGELGTIRHDINQTKQDVKTELRTWLYERQNEIQERFQVATQEVTILRDTFLKLRDEIQTELVEQKQKEKYLEYQKGLEQKLYGWLQEKDDYMISKMVEFNTQIKKCITQVDNRELYFNEIFSEETLQEYVAEIERRFKISQDAYNLRRKEEFNSRYFRLEKLVEVAYEYIEDGKQLQISMENTYNEKALQKFVKDIEFRLKQFQGEWMLRKNDYFQGQFMNIRTEVEKLSKAAAAAEEREANLASLYGEKTVKKLIQDVEGRLKLIQDGWIRKRNQELNTRYEEFKEQIVKVLKIAVETRELGKKIEQMHGEDKLKMLVTESMKGLEIQIKTTNDMWNKEQTLRYNERYMELQNELNTIKQREKTFLDWQTSHEAICEKILTSVENFDDLETRISDFLIVEREHFKISRTNISKEFQKEILKLITNERMTYLQNTILLEIQKSLKNVYVDHAKHELEQLVGQFINLREFVDTLENRLNSKILEELDTKYEPILEEKLEIMKENLLQRNERWLKIQSESMTSKQNSLFYTIEKEIRDKFMDEETKCQTVIEQLQKQFELEINDFNTYKNTVEEQINKLNTFQKGWNREFEKEFREKFRLEVDNNKILRMNLQEKHQEELNKLDETKTWIRDQVAKVKIIQSNWHQEIEKDIKNKFVEDQTLLYALRQKLERHLNSVTEYFTKNEKTILESLNQMKNEYNVWTEEFSDITQRNILQEALNIRRENEMWQNNLEDQVKKKFTYDYKNSLVRTELSRQLQEELQKFIVDDKLVGLGEYIITTLRKKLKEIHSEYAKYEFINIITRLNTIDDKINTIEAKNTRITQNPWARLAGSVIEDKFIGLHKCFYTALFETAGQNSQSLAVIDKKIPGWDYICFTNQDIQETNGWTIVKTPLTTPNSLLEIKRYKWLSHKYLLDYDVAVWIDSNVAPRFVFHELLKQWIMKMMDSNISILHRPHDERNCVFLECDELQRSGNENPRIVEKFKKLLLDAGVKRKGGLFNTDVMIKLHKNIELQKISEYIYNYVEQSPTNDQLIVPLVYEKEKFKSYLQDNLIRAFEQF